MDQILLKELYKEYYLTFPRCRFGNFDIFKDAYLNISKHENNKDKIFLEIRKTFLYARKRVLKNRKNSFLDSIGCDEVNLEYLIRELNKKIDVIGLKKIKPKHFDEFLVIARIIKLNQKDIINYLNPCGLSWDGLRKRSQRALNRISFEEKVMTALFDDQKSVYKRNLNFE